MAFIDAAQRDYGDAPGQPGERGESHPAERPPAGVRSCRVERRQEYQVSLCQPCGEDFPRIMNGYGAQ